MTHLRLVNHLIYCHVVFLEDNKLCGIQRTVFIQAELYADYVCTQRSAVLYMHM